MTRYNSNLSIPKIKIDKMRWRRKGERTLTSSDKKKKIKSVGKKCQRCHKSFPKLVVHHKKHIARYKPKGVLGRELGTTLEVYNTRKKKAHYDRDKNLMVLCPNCHAIVHHQESLKRKEKEITKKIKEIQSLWIT